MPKTVKYNSYSKFDSPGVKPCCSQRLSIYLTSFISSRFGKKADILRQLAMALVERTN
jgi:hypothetical protein